MTVRMYFEKLSPGLKAKLDARYRVKNSRTLKDIGASNLRLTRNHYGIGLPADGAKLSAVD